MKTKLLLALMACMCVVSCKKDSDATNGADDSIYGVWEGVFYAGVNYQRDLFVGGKPANEVDRNLRECAEKQQERYSMVTNCYTFDDVVKHYEGKLTDIKLDSDGEKVEVKIIPIDKSNHTAKMIVKEWIADVNNIPKERTEEWDVRVFENTIFIDFGEGDKHDEIDFEIKYKGGKPTKLYLMSQILADGENDVNCGSAACGEQVTLKMKYVHYILCTKVREL